MRNVLIAFIALFFTAMQAADAKKKHTSNGDATSTQGSTKDLRARAFCPMTGVVGFGHDPLLETAMSKAVDDCIRKGGIDDCCHKFVKQLL